MLEFAEYSGDSDGLLGSEDMQKLRARVHELQQEVVSLKAKNMGLEDALAVAREVYEAEWSAELQRRVREEVHKVTSKKWTSLRLAQAQYPLHQHTSSLAQVSPAPVKQHTTPKGGTGKGNAVPPPLDQSLSSSINDEDSLQLSNEATPRSPPHNHAATNTSAARRDVASSPIFALDLLTLQQRSAALLHPQSSSGLGGDVQYDPLIHLQHNSLGMSPRDGILSDDVRSVGTLGSPVPTPRRTLRENSSEEQPYHYHGGEQVPEYLRPYLSSTTSLPRNASNDTNNHGDDDNDQQVAKVVVCVDVKDEDLMVIRAGIKDINKYAERCPIAGGAREVLHEAMEALQRLQRVKGI
eukprot:PhF_6_TR40945/c0_g1_i2/m.61961